MTVIVGICVGVMMTRNDIVLFVLCVFVFSDDIGIILLFIFWYFGIGIDSVVHWCLLVLRVCVNYFLISLFYFWWYSILLLLIVLNWYDKWLIDDARVGYEKYC